MCQGHRICDIAWFWREDSKFPALHQIFLGDHIASWIQSGVWVDILFPGLQGHRKTKELLRYFHSWLWTPVTEDGKESDRQTGPWWTMSGQPDPGEEAFLLSCWSPGRPRAKTANVLHVRIKMVWQRNRGEMQLASPCQTRPIYVLGTWKINIGSYPVNEPSFCPCFSSPPYPESTCLKLWNSKWSPILILSKNSVFKWEKHFIADCLTSQQAKPPFSSSLIYGCVLLHK